MGVGREGLNSLFRVQLVRWCTGQAFLHLEFHAMHDPTASERQLLATPEVPGLGVIVAVPSGQDVWTALMTPPLNITVYTCDKDNDIL